MAARQRLEDDGRGLATELAQMTASYEEASSRAQRFADDAAELHTQLQAARGMQQGAFKDMRAYIEREAYRVSQKVKTIVPPSLPAETIAERAAERAAASVGRGSGTDGDFGAAPAAASQPPMS